MSIIICYHFLKTRKPSKLANGTNSITLEEKGLQHGNEYFQDDRRSEFQILVYNINYSQRKEAGEETVAVLLHGTQPGMSYDLLVPRSMHRFSRLLSTISSTRIET
jgi:hypothetical protein